jgi:5-methylcytosine-specific restriction protein A
MPRQAPRTCTYQGCSIIVPKGRCEQHALQARQQQDRETDARRPTAAQRGYDARWRIVRDNQLQEFPLCALCEKKGRAISAECVDHIVPIVAEVAGLYEPSNLQSLCHSCHSRKTASEDGGFGGPSRDRAHG